MPHSAVLYDLAIDGDRDKSARLVILELNDLMTLTGKLAPAARLLRVLCDSCNIPDRPS